MSILWHAVPRIHHLKELIAPFSNLSRRNFQISSLEVCHLSPLSQKHVYIYVDIKLYSIDIVHAWCNQVQQRLLLAFDNLLIKGLKCERNNL